MSDPKRDKKFDQADKAISSLRKSSEPGAKKRVGAWQKMMNREAQTPYNDKEKKLFSKGNKVLKDLGHKPKQKPGLEAKKVRGMTKALSNKYGSADNAARDPKVKNKVNRVYNKMLDDKGKSLEESMWDEYMKMYENYGTGGAKRAAFGGVQQKTSAAEASRIKQDAVNRNKPLQPGERGYKPNNYSQKKGGMSDSKLMDLKSRAARLRKESYTMLERYNNLDKQAKLDKMATRGTPNEQKVAQKKLKGPSLPKFD